jgi:hypothetical protein
MNIITLGLLADKRNPFHRKTSNPQKAKKVSDNFLLVFSFFLSFSPTLNLTKGVRDFHFFFLPLLLLFNLSRTLSIVLEFQVAE